MLKYWPKKCVKKTVAACLSASKIVPSWFVTNSMLEKLDNSIFSNDDAVFFDEDFDSGTISSDDVSLITI